MSSPADALLAILTLEPAGADAFIGNSPPDGRQRVFGGQVLAQALLAACRTVEDRSAHSLHAYFLLPGDPLTPIVYEVERLRDGRSFTTRRVVARQQGTAIFATSISFHGDEPGYDHQMAPPAVLPPEKLPSIGELELEATALIPAPILAYFRRARAVEVRLATPGRYAAGAGETAFAVWFRVAGRLPDDPLIHQASLAYLSDMTLLDTSLGPHGRSVFEPEIMAASLDHALWLHRPFRADEWLLYSQDTPSAGGARGFARGLIHDSAGRLIASVAQEGLIRPRTSRA